MYVVIKVKNILSYLKQCYNLGLSWPKPSFLSLAKEMENI